MDFKLGRAKNENVVKGEKYRITVLSEGLLRLEYNSKGIFYDAPSQFAINRDFDVVPMEIKQDDKFLEIKTKYFTLTYVKEKNFDAGKILPMANLKIDVNGMESTWYVNHAEVKNMNGLFISEDGPSINQKFQRGLYCFILCNSTLGVVPFRKGGSNKLYSAFNCGTCYRTFAYRPWHRAYPCGYPYPDRPLFRKPSYPRQQTEPGCFRR